MENADKSLLSHANLWRAIDALAADKNMSPSALARLAGLDPTAFNKSKRFGADGRPHWPSTESLFRILECTQTSLQAFAKLVEAGETKP